MTSLLHALKNYFSSQATPEQAKDTGMALVLICLLINFFVGYSFFLTAAIFILLVDMVYPAFFRPLARIWFGVSQLLGTIMSKIILSIIFFLILTPIGLIRRALGADTLLLKEWKKDNSSVFKVRDHTFGPDDILNPY
jgi:hypothetical protein